jgi:purine-nucleoside/S-methyl-5'-thioadenosine phosphorylase / adenosine deaminase
VPETSGDSGFLAIPLGEGLALFGDARSAPGRLSAEELAGAAGAAIQRTTAREVPVLYARQEHTRLAFTFSAPDALRPGPHLVGTCDALLTAEPWTALTVRTADCLPVALAGGGAVAMVHAGWRGLAADVLGAAVRCMHSEFGVPAAAVRAVVGVGIGPCHYPVGEEVVAALSLHAVREAAWRTGGAVDLAAWARGRLLELGVPNGGVRVLPGCTACSPSHHSYRRDGARAGRQWTALVLARGFRLVSPAAS